MVSFTYPNSFTIQMPTRADLAALMQISRNALHPKARPLDSFEAAQYLAEFTSAFLFIATLQRTDVFQRASDWCSRGEAWHFARGDIQASVSLSPLMAAILAAGDISWQAPVDRWPHDVFAGIGWSGGRAATAAWQNVLATGKTLPPIAVASKGLYPAPVPTIRQLNMVHGDQAKPFG